MRNNEWIDLPVYQTELYPKRIRDIAKKVGATVEEIANNEGIAPGAVLWEWVKREDIMDIFRIIEYPEDDTMSVIILLSGEQLIVNMPHRKLMARIHKFLLTEPQYDFSQEGSAQVEIVEINGERNDEQ